MRLYLMRHGEAENNVDISVHFSKSNPSIELTDKGKEQSEQAAEKIYRHYALSSPCANNEPVVIFSSPYKRAVQTAEYLRKKQFHKAAYREEVLLVEQNYGTATGFKSIEEFANGEANSKIGQFEQKYLLKTVGRFFMKLPQGESQLDVAMRAELFLNKIERHGCVIVAVSHKIFCETFHSQLMGYSDKDELWENAETRVYDIFRFGSTYHYQLERLTLE